MSSEMSAAEPHNAARGSELLMEHCAALDTEKPHPTAHERLERIVGGYLARLLVGALTGSRRSRSADFD
jgi:hypothetical protein